MDTKLVVRLLESARSVMPLADVRAVSLDDELRSRSGETVRAQVAARLADGSARVLIEGRPFKVALPPEVKAGDVLQLRILPRATDPARSPPASTHSRPDALSNAGQLIARALAQPASEPPRQSAPVLAVPPSRPEDLPEPLARAVERSGVFYESHQARWLEGDFSIERLLDEPQARLGAHPPSTGKPLVVPAPSEPFAPKLEQSPPRVNPTLPAQAAAPAADASESDVPPLPSAFSVTGTLIDSDGEPVERVSHAVIHDALPIVRQQLDTLETRQLTWLGDIWPGQPMRWEIGEESDAPTNQSESREWHSRFTLTLPALGEVAAELTVHGTRIGLRISARSSDSAALMSAHSTELVSAMQDAGLNVARCEICPDARAL